MKKEEKNVIKENETISKDKKKIKLYSIVILVLVALIVIFLIGITIFAIFGYNFVKARLSNINYENIDIYDLEISEEPIENEVVTETEFNEIKTILLLGSDSRNVDNMYAGRSDSIIVASLNPKTKSIKLISIPRDTYVNIPGYGMDKINHSYAYGSEQLLIKTINSNFGLNITEYITIDFLGLAKVINSIGGIDMDISYDEMEIINMYLHEIYALENMAYKPMTDYGYVHLTGEQAVAHCRDRYVGSDFTRTARQRKVIMAVIEKLSNMEKTEVLKVLDLALNQVHTNASVKEYLPEITSLILHLDEYQNNTISAQVPSLEYGYDQYINGIYYFGSDLERAKQDFWSYIYEK